MHEINKAIIERIVDSECPNRDKLIDMTLRLKLFEPSIQYLLKLIKTEKNPELNNRYKLLMMDLSHKKEGYIRSFSRKKRFRVVSDLADFKLDADDWEVYERLERFLIAVFKNCSSEDDEDFFSELLDRQGIYTPYILAVFSSLFRSIDASIYKYIWDQCAEKYVYNFHGLEYFFRTHRLEKIDDNTRKLYENHGEDRRVTHMVKEFITSEEIREKRCGYLLLKGLHSFLPCERCVPITMSLRDTICKDLKLNHPVLNTYIAACIAYLPAYTYPDISTTADQIKTFLPPLAECIYDPESRYIEYVLLFCRHHVGNQEIDIICERLLNQRESLRAGLLIGADIGLFDRNQDIIKSAFPPNHLSKDKAYAVVSALPTIIKRDRTSDALAHGIFNAFFNICCSQLMREEEVRKEIFRSIPSVVSLYPRYNTAFSRATAESLGPLRDKEVLRVIATEVDKIFARRHFRPRSPEIDPRSFSYFFYNFILHHQEQEDLKYVASLLHIFNPIRLPKPESILDIVDYYVPEKYEKTIINNGLIHLPKHPEFCPVVCLFKGLHDDNFESIIETAFLTTNATDKEAVSEKLVVDTFKALCRRYPVVALDKVQEYSDVEKIKIFAKKKKEYVRTVKWAILAALGSMLPPGSRLSPEQQSLVYKILINIIPQGDEVNKFPGEYVKVTDVVPFLKDYPAPQELINTVADKFVFAPVMPYMLTKRDDYPQICEPMCDSMLKYLSWKQEPSPHSQAVADTLFRLKPDQEMYKYVLRHVSRQFKTQNPNPFIDFTFCCCETVKRYRLTMPSNVVTEFYICLSDHLLSRDPPTVSNTLKLMMSAMRINPPRDYKDPTSDVDKNMPQEAVHTTSTIILRRVFEKCPEENSIDVARKLMYVYIKKPDKLPLHYCLVLNGAITARGANIVTTDPDIISWVLTIASTSTGPSSYHLTCSLLELAMSSLKEFFPLLLHVKNREYLVQFVKYLIRSEITRDKFYTLFLQFLADNVDNLEFYTLVPIVTLSEDIIVITPNSFGFLVTALIAWIAAVNGHPKPGNHTNYSRKEINNCLNHILARTNVGERRVNLKLKYGRFREVIEIINELSTQLIGVSTDRMFTLVHYAENLSLSKYEPYKQAVNIFYVELLKSYGLFTDTESVRLSERLSRSIAITLYNSAPNEAVLMTSYINRKLESEHLKHLHSENAPLMYAAIIKAMGHAQHIDFSDALGLVHKIQYLVDDSFVKEHSDHILLGLRNYIKNASFNIHFLDLLEIFVNVRTRVTDFIEAEHKLNMVYLLNLCAHTDFEIRERCIALLKRLFDSIEPGYELNDFIASRVAHEYIRAVKQTEINHVTMYFLEILVDACLRIRTEESIEFRVMAAKLMLDFVGHPQFDEQAVRIISKVT